MTIHVCTSSIWHHVVAVIITLSLSRYQAQCKSMAEGVSTLDSFSIVRSNPNEFGPLGLDSGSTGRKPARGVAHHVYLCHRGYNHIAGKLLKSHK